MWPIGGGFELSLTRRSSSPRRSNDELYGTHPAGARGTLIVICRFYFLLALLLAATEVGASSGMAAKEQRPTPVGIWLHANKRLQIEITPCGERLCGTLVWFQWPNDAQGLPLVDVKNKNPALRTRPLLGLSILYGLRRTGDNTWEDGKIYNPDDGNDYNAQMSIGGDGTLRVRAYVLLPPLGKTLIWSRVS
jgi:uncharacterized protein (DUF2147 family)